MGYRSFSVRYCLTVALSWGPGHAEMFFLVSSKFKTDLVGRWIKRVANFLTTRLMIFSIKLELFLRFIVCLSIFFFSEFRGRITWFF